MSVLVIWGCGGHGRVVFDIATAMQSFTDIVFFEDHASSPSRMLPARVLSGSFQQIGSVATTEFVVAIGANQVRAARFLEGLDAGFTPAVCIHPSAVISPFAVIGVGTVVMPRAVVQAGATVGRNCIINSGAIVEHDCVIGDHAHLSPAVALGGGVIVGAYAHMGVSSAAIPGSAIGEGAIVGAGAVVLREIPPDVTAVGVPARTLGKRDARKA